jgi:hypothetical protein
MGNGGKEYWRILKARNAREGEADRRAYEAVVTSGTVTI